MGWGLEIWHPPRYIAVKVECIDISVLVVLMPLVLAPKLTFPSAEIWISTGSSQFNRNRCVRSQGHVPRGPDEIVCLLKCLSRGNA